MGTPIKELSVEGFKSIRKLEKFELRNLNVLIGANGAGKSNFVELFRLMRALANGALQNYVRNAGGGDGFFFGGPKESRHIKMRFVFGQDELRFTLEPAVDGKLTITDELFGDPNGNFHSWRTNGFEFESNLKPHIQDELNAGLSDGIGTQVFRGITGRIVYHFHDTSSLAPMRREQAVEDAAYLRPDASNIAAFLLVMRRENPREYDLIRDTVRIVAPFFDDFLLKERWNGNESKVALDWHQKGSDFPFQAWHLSDGTLRFICLATALLQPNPPPTIVIDEPELGLHPHALEILAGLLQKASQRMQVIVSTQSAPLLSQFEPEDVITVTRKEGASVFGRLERKDLEEWMKDYTLGELWQKNVVEAGASDD